MNTLNHEYYLYTGKTLWHRIFQGDVTLNPNNFGRTWYKRH